MIFLLTLGGITLAGLCILLVVAGFQKANVDVKNKYESAQSSIFKERVPINHTDSSNGGEAEVTSELLKENPRYGNVLADEEYMAASPKWHRCIFPAAWKAHSALCAWAKSPGVCCAWAGWGMKISASCPK